MSLLPAVKVIAPKASRETGRPVEPRVVYCMRSARAARSRPYVEIAFERVTIDPLQLLGGELQVTQCAQAFLHLLPAAGADQRAGDSRLAQHPLAAALERAAAAEVLPQAQRNTRQLQAAASAAHIGNAAGIGGQGTLANLSVAVVCGLVHAGASCAVSSMGVRVGWPDRFWRTRRLPS